MKNRVAVLGSEAKSGPLVHPLVTVVNAARDGAKQVGCEFLHVGFDDTPCEFYIDRCGFEPTLGDLMEP